MLRRFEQFGTVGFLLLLMGLFSNLLWGSAIAEDSASSAGTPVSLLMVEAAIYLSCALLIALHYKTTLRSLFAAWPFLLISAYAAASTLWSADPSITLRRSAVLLATTLFGVYLGGRHTAPEFQRLLLQGLFVLVAASLILFAVAPAVVLDPYHRESFRGLTEHKNLFGEFMGEMLLLAATCPYKTARPFVRIALVLLAAGMLFWSHSGTALFAAALTIAIVPMLLLVKFKKLQAIPLMVSACVLLGFAIVLLSRASNTVLDLLGKDQTLTGRSDVWKLVWQSILRRPLLGYGFDAFWGGLRGESFHVISVVGWSVAHSHNGYLELLLGFGFVGGALVLIALGRYAVQAIGYVRSQRGITGLWPIALLLFCLVHGFAEAGLVKRDGFSYLLLVVTGTSLAVRRERNRAAAVLKLRSRAYGYDLVGGAAHANR